MEVLLVSVIVILIGLLFYNQNNFRKVIKSYDYIIKRGEEEITATLFDNKESYKTEIDNKLMLLRAEKEKEIKNLEIEHSNKLERKNRYINNLEKYSRNRGEILTHEILNRIKNKLVQDQIISSEEMIIMGNIFVPFTTNKNEVMSRQIDHLILLPNCIYIIETKYWQGCILQGVSKENAGELSSIFRNLFPEIKNGDEKTLVIGSPQQVKDDSNSTRDLNVISYGNPVKQVRETAIKLNEYIKDKTHKNKLVKTIVYFGYPKDDVNNVKVFSKKPDDKDNLATIICTESSELINYFNNQIRNSKRLYSVEELKEIQNVMNQFNRIM